MTEKKRPTLNVFFPEESLRTQFKQLCARAKTSMSKRAIALIKRDIAYWSREGTVEEIKDGDLRVGLDELVKQNFLQLVNESGLEPIRLQEIVSRTGSPPTWAECNQLAEVLDMDVEEVFDRSQEVYKKESRNEPTQTTRN